MTRPDPDSALLLGGLLAIGLGAFVVMTEVDLAWAGAAVLGLVLLLVARKLPTSTRLVPVVLTALGLVALAGAVVGLAT